MKKNFNKILDHTIKSPIISGQGVYLFTKDKKEYLDSTGRYDRLYFLGGVINMFREKLLTKKIEHIDYKTLKDENRENLKK